jgi:hypothetical protein
MSNNLNCVFINLVNDCFLYLFIGVITVVMTYSKSFVFCLL